MGNPPLQAAGNMFLRNGVFRYFLQTQGCFLNFSPLIKRPLKLDSLRNREETDETALKSQEEEEEELSRHGLSTRLFRAYPLQTHLPRILFSVSGPKSHLLLPWPSGSGPSPRIRHLLARPPSPYSPIRIRFSNPHPSDPARVKVPRIVRRRRRPGPLCGLPVRVRGTGRNPTVGELPPYISSDLFGPLVRPRPEDVPALQSSVHPGRVAGGFL